jgi:hypothetical protein
MRLLRPVLTALDYTAGTAINLAVLIAGILWEVALAIAVIAGIALALRLL